MTISAERALEKRRRFHWEELDDTQFAALVGNLSAASERKPVEIQFSDAEAQPLAEDLAMAFLKAGWQATFSSALGTSSGITVSDAALAHIIGVAAGVQCQPFAADEPLAAEITSGKRALIIVGQKAWAAQ